jgi:N-acetylneuraminic acid mutarotase
MSGRSPLRSSCLRSLFVALGLAACGDDAGRVADAQSGDVVVGEGWSMGTAVGRGAIQETAAVGVAGKIYVLGGFDADERIVARAQIYDTATGAWSDGPALPRAVHHANVVTDGTTIYVLGALFSNNFAAVGDVYRFTPGVSTAWTAGTPMPSGRERGAAVAGFIGNQIYVAGGLRNVQASNLVDVYHPMDDVWTPLADLPAARDHACGGTVNGRLVVAGGRMVSSSAPLPEVWLYDPGGNSWAAGAPMLTARGGMGCGVIDDVLYTAGGEGDPTTASGVFDEVESYSPDTQTWTSHGPMIDPKHGVGGAVWDGALYLCGGANVEGFGAIATTSVFRP